MTASPADERDTKLRVLIKTMFERVPKEKKLTADVVMQLLKTKYATTFPEEYLAERKEFLTGLIDSFYNPKSSDVKKDSYAHGNDKEDEREEEDDEDEDEESDEDNEEDEEGDDEEDFASEELDETGEDTDDGDGAPVEKRQRIEEGEGEVVRRCHEMVNCLSRLSYRVRKQGEGESPDAYLQQCLVPLFREKGLDPERYSKADIKRYRAMKEIEQLKSDGADMSLDRAARVGRGLNHLFVRNDTTINVKTSEFLDDE